MSFLQRTFQLIKGVGPWRERELWARGLATWADFERAAGGGAVMSSKLDQALLAAIAEARQAVAQGDLAALARRVPAREHWRLYPEFAAQAAFFDIEADGEGAPTVVGVMDRRGVASFRRGVDLRQVPARLAESPLWVTFNGGAYDVPLLERAFEAFPRPLVHVDLRFLVRKARLKGGLKAVERALGMPRPPHLEGVRGLDAIRLWREFHGNGDRAALKVLVEYNLYDAIDLRPVLERTLRRLSDLAAWPPAEGLQFERGDALYDVSRLVMGL